MVRRMTDRAAFPWNLGSGLLDWPFHGRLGGLFESDQPWPSSRPERLGPGAARYPAVNIWMREADGAAVTAELPGVRASDVRVDAHGSTLTISGSRSEAEASEGEVRLLAERGSGHFERTLEFPFTIDATRVEARLVNGVLDIVVPRSSADQPRKIKITTA